MNSTLAVGFTNIVMVSEIEAICSPKALPTRRRVRALKSADMVIDVTHGRAAASVIFLKSGRAVLSSVKVRTLQQRIDGTAKNSEGEEKDE